MTTPAISATGSKKLPFLELLRILASFCVIINHTVPDVFLEAAPSPVWFSGLFYFFASKIAVPLFLMISGYILLDRQDSYKTALLRFLKTCCSLILFSGIYYWVYCLYGVVEGPSVGAFLQMVLSGPITNAYWYLYMYLGLLLMMPFLQKLVSAMKKEDFHVLFLCSGVLYGFWPLVIHYIPKLTYSGYFSAPLFFGEIALLLLGCYLKRYSVPSPRWKRLSVLGFFGCCLLNTVLTYFEYSRTGGVDYLFLDYYQNLPIVLEGLCAFYFVSTLSFGQRTAKRIVSLGCLTFGIYLLSDLFKNCLNSPYLRISAKLGVPMLTLLAYELLIFALAAAVTFVLKKLPGVKKLL